ncbi:MAG: D-alanyl-D-alanine carboxypeptidase [Lachnospiraceae bacterium]|nr:D-alanyl-D-alanine carboxypeptidase [Lachnospiraceae bacterium]
MYWRKRILAIILSLISWLIPAWSLTMPVSAEVKISSPSVVLMESSTGKVIYELNATDRRSPASITKIMTLLLTFEQLDAGKIALEDEVLVSTYASSMGGSQVYLAEGEIQSLETMIKCITISSGNDASVAVAEHIAGSEEAFVAMMNQKAAELGLADTHFMDSCGLSDSDEHYTSARDVAIMSRELISKYPKVLQYTTIWMEDIVHETKNGSSNFTLSSTNKLLKQYQWTTGLKTGSTSKAKYCISATASKDGIDLIAVVMGAPDPKTRFGDAKTLLSFGYSVCSLYIDENTEPLPNLMLEKGVEKEVPLRYESEFRYLDTEGNGVSGVEKIIELPDSVPAPVEEGQWAGVARYMLAGKEIGQIPVLYAATVEKAGLWDYLQQIWKMYLL